VFTEYIPYRSAAKKQAWQEPGYHPWGKKSSQGSGVYPGIFNDDQFYSRHPISCSPQQNHTMFFTGFAWKDAERSRNSLSWTLILSSLVITICVEKGYCDK
jgi:hypothetical protein